MEKGADNTARWIGACAGGLFALIGSGAALWRYELRLDLLSRSYTRRKGFWPSPAIEQGNFSDIEHVVLEVEYRRAGERDSGASATWQVGLKLRQEARPIRVGEENSEEAGFRIFESLAKKLRVTAIDRTGPEEKIRSWEQMDERIAAPGRSGIPSLPAGSRIEFFQLAQGQTIRLPHIGFGFGVAFFILFGLAFLGFAALFAWAKLAGPVPIQESSAAAGWLVTTVFALFGLGIALLGFFGASAKDMVREESGGLIFSQYFLGKERLARRVEKREVEDVSIKAARHQSGGSSFRVGARGLRLPPSVAPSRMEVVVRSDRYVARLGSDPSPEEREWLRAALAAMAAQD